AAGRKPVAPHAACPAVSASRRRRAARHGPGGHATAGGQEAWLIAGGKSFTVRTELGASTTARSSAFWSSRTLPGQGYACNMSRAAGVIVSPGRLTSRL